MKTIRLLSITLFFAVMFNPCLHAQSSLLEVPSGALELSVKEKYEKEAIYLNGSQNKYIKDNKRLNVGVFSKKLLKEFANSSKETKMEIEKSIRNERQGALLLTVSGIAVIGAVVVTGPVGLVVLGASLVPYTVSLIKINRSTNQLQKAIWLHNRDVLEQLN